jgi:hypothetical protein
VWLSKPWISAFERTTHSELKGDIAVNLYGFQPELFRSVVTTDFRSTGASVLKIKLYQLVDAYFAL